MTIQNQKLESPTGATLNLYSIVPQNPKAIIQINHGMAEHAARYHPLMLALYDAGYGAYAHDHRGHGKTTAPDAHQGYFGKKDGFGKVLDDVDTVTNLIKQNHAGVPIVCFGHSMGMIIALNYAVRNPQNIEAIALWNSNARAGILGYVFKALMRIEAFFKGSDVPSLLAVKLTFADWNKKLAPTRTDFDWLSTDEAQVDKYIADPLCGFVTCNRLWQDVMGGIFHIADDENLKNLPKNLPVNIVAGDKDPCSENGAAMAKIADRMKAVGMNNVTLDIKKGARHETLNELQRDTYIKEFIAWLGEKY